MGVRWSFVQVILVPAVGAQRRQSNKGMPAATAFPVVKDHRGRAQAVGFQLHRRCVAPVVEQGQAYLMSQVRHRLHGFRSAKGERHQ